MMICSTIKELREKLAQLKIERGRELVHRRTQNEAEHVTVGFVPTMGYLHQGHASLLDRARTTCDITVLSIFVNPLQFAPGEDLAMYPRDSERDLAVAMDYGTDLVFMPSVAEMYPEGKQSLTTVHVSQVTEKLCGASRPGHFTGVATVVCKLLNIVQPDRAFFGMKDAQQVAVIEQMSRDLNIPVEIVPCPTIRESDGLALSSRNVYLTESERSAATVLSRALQSIDNFMGNPTLTFAQLRQHLLTVISAESLAVIDYVDILQYPSFSEIPDVSCAEWLGTPNRRVLIALAVKFGKTRLIDNRLLGGGHFV